MYLKNPIWSAPSRFAALLTISAFVVGWGGAGEAAEKATAAGIPEVSVKFGNAAFLDHTDAAIGVAKGWFSDVGISLDPSPIGSLIDPPDHASALLSGRVEVQSTNYQILMPAFNKSDNLRMFAYGDFFIGFALMGKKEYKSFSEFTAEGKSPQEALKAAAAQLPGKTLTWSPDPAVRNFGRTVLRATGVKDSELKFESLNDSQGIQLMFADRADFQVGGAPSRVTLEKEGFKPIITAADLTGIVKEPYESSEELAAVSTNGWGTTLDYWKKNPDTVMRMASVKWRITQFIHDHPDEAAAIHVQQLNRVAGTDLTAEDAKIIYKSIDPYIPFDRQQSLWFDPSKPTYEQTMIKAAIKQAEDAGTLDAGKVRPEDVTIAHVVYQRALDLKAEADKTLAAVQTELASAPESKKKVVSDLVTAARQQYAAFNFLDASRLSKEAEQRLNQ